MTKETFTQLIKTIQSNNEIVNQAYKLKVDLIEFTDSWEKVITILLKEVFNEEGYDWISWWLEENDREAWEQDGTPIPMDTIEDLYNYLVNEGYVK